MTPTQYLKHLSYEVCSLIESGDHDLDKILRAESKDRLLRRLVLCEKLEAQYLIGWNRERGNDKGVSRQQNYLDVAERALTCL